MNIQNLQPASLWPVSVMIGLGPDYLRLGIIFNIIPERYGVSAESVNGTTQVNITQQHHIMNK